MPKKKKVISIFKNGFILRSYNRRITVTEVEDGYKVEVLNCRENKEGHRTCHYHRKRGVDCTQIVMSKDMILGMAQGIVMLDEYRKLNNTTKNKYRCPYCEKIQEMESDKQWIKSYCDEKMKMVRLQLIKN